jgi:hypothetical protein
MAGLEMESADFLQAPRVHNEAALKWQKDEGDEAEDCSG